MRESKVNIDVLKSFLDDHGEKTKIFYFEIKTDDNLNLEIR